MKIALIITALMISVTALAAKVEVDVSGMSCGMCVEAITKELKATEKAENIKVSLEDKKAYFTETKGATLADAEIKAVFKKAGYTAEKIRRK